MKGLAIVAACGMAVCLCSCQRTPGEVMDKVLVDFGVREAPEGYESGSDRVFERLSEVAKTEMARLNQEGRHGAIKYQEQDGIRGKYYKEVKVYDGFHPLDAGPVPRDSAGGRGYTGYIEYTYTIFQSARMSSRTEAAAESPAIATNQTGREVYRYRFTASGAWDGGKGEKVRRR